MRIILLSLGRELGRRTDADGLDGADVTKHQGVPRTVVGRLN